ncbi:MAG: peptide chain release factor N(5)-glutamine methyltransferase [Bacteroidales bacterium]
MTKQTIKEIKAQIIHSLAELYQKKEAESIANRVIEDVMKTDPLEETKTHVPEAERKTMLDIYLKRLLNSEPVQYVTGCAYFRNLKLKVNPHVLIPRSETEFLVEEVLNHFQNRKDILFGLDIGTGTACIPVSLETESNHIVMEAMDNSQLAIMVAKENTAFYKTKTKLLVDDILNPEYTKYRMGKYDFIVSNPPYVLVSDKAKMHENVLNYEPAEALYVPDGQALLFYNAILNFADKKLKNKGWLFLEIHEEKGEELHKLLQERNYYPVKIIQDLNNKDRFIKAMKRDSVRSG